MIWRAKGFSAKLFLTTDKSRPRCACANYEAAHATDFSPGFDCSGSRGVVNANAIEIAVAGFRNAGRIEGRRQDAAQRAWRAHWCAFRYGAGRGCNAAPRR